MSKIKKIKLYAIGNEGKFNYYVFEKKNYVIEFLAKAFNSLGIEIYLRDQYVTDSGKGVDKKINFEKIVDKHYRYESPKDYVRVDVFYGKKKVFLTLICSQKDRLKFNNQLKDMEVMLEYKFLEKCAKIKDKHKVLGDFKINKYFLKKKK